MSRCVLYFCSCCCCCLFISYPIHAFHKQRMSAGRRIHWPPMMQVKHMFHSLTKSLPRSLSLSLSVYLCLSLSKSRSVYVAHTHTHTYMILHVLPSLSKLTRSRNRRHTKKRVVPLLGTTFNSICLYPDYWSPQKPTEPATTRENPSPLSLVLEFPLCSLSLSLSSWQFYQNDVLIDSR